MIDEEGKPVAKHERCGGRGEGIWEEVTADHGNAERPVTKHTTYTCKGVEGREGRGRRRESRTRGREGRRGREDRWMGEMRGGVIGNSSPTISPVGIFFPH